ncbi:MAG TPA: DUF2079 domain-containing protein [Coleofasciculaceae cyanobacterium]|jgi:uncharacterized membrane protein
MQKTPVYVRFLSTDLQGFYSHLLKTYPLPLMIGTSSLIFFACSSLRHALFQSGAFDLGIYDQVVYLISQGRSPISSILEFHHLGNHAAWAVYPLALLYKIHPNVHWLLAVQAVALALGAWPTWSLARQAGLTERQAMMIAAVYLLYPVVFNVNLFDFHPEVMALPALLGTVWAARQNQIVWFSLGIIFVLGCKAVLSLTVVAMGFWLFFFEKKRRCGAIALVLGIAWFLVATKVIIPFFSGSQPAAMYRYSYLGNSFPEIVKNLLLKPKLVWDKVEVRDSLRYLGQLVLPVIWGLSPKYLAPLVSALPTLLLNILSETGYQRDLGCQYSVPVVPFLLVAVISTLATGQGWLRNRQVIILWSFLSFLGIGNHHLFWSNYPTTLDTWEATREAIYTLRSAEGTAQVQSQGGVLTTNNVAPHLSERPLVKLAFAETPTADVAAAASINFAEIDYILLNTRYPGWQSTPEYVASLVEQFKQDESFQLRYQRDDVYLFVKKVEGQT